MESSSGEQEGVSNKKGPFDSLSREELIKKCKGLLVIAQKAKQAKDEFHTENKTLKEELQNYETQKHADKECLKAMQEMVEALTQNKLTSATTINDLQNRVTKLEAQLKRAAEECSQTSNLSIENESLHRQIKRLADENDDLLKDFETLERKFEDVSKISLEQQKGFLILEKSSEKLQDENNRLAEQVEVLQTKNVKCEEKFQIFRNKIIEFSQKLKQLKASRQVLIEIVRDYSGTIPKWQIEIGKLSANIFERVRHYETENKELQAKLNEIVDNNEGDETLKKKIIELEQTVENLSKSNSQLEEETASLTITVEQLTKNLADADGNDNEKIRQMQDAVDEATLKLNSKCEEIKILSDKLNELETSRETLTTNNLSLEEEIQKHSLNIERLNVQAEEKNSKVVAESSETIKELQEDLSATKLKIGELKQELSEKCSEVKDLVKKLEETNNQLSQVSNSREEQMKNYETENLKLQEAVSAVNNQLVDRDTRVKELESNSKDFIDSNQTIKELEEDLSTTTAKIEELKQELHEKCVKMEELVKKVTTLEETNNQLSEVTNSREEQLKNYEEENFKLQEAVNAVNNQLAERVTKVKELESNCKDLAGSSQTIKGLEDDLSAKTANIKELKHELTEKCVEMKELFNKVTTLEETNKQLSQVSNSREEQLRKYEEENLKLKEAVNTVNNQLADQNTENTAADSQKKIQELEEVNYRLQSELEGRKIELETVSTELLKSQHEIGELLVQIQILEGNNQIIEKRIAEITAKINDDTNETAVHLESRLSEKTIEVEQLKNSIKELKKAHETSENAKLRTAIQDYYDLKEQFDQRLHDIEILKSSLIFASTRLDEIDTATDTIAEEFYEKESLIEQLETENEELKEKSARIVHLESCMSRTVEKLSIITETIDELKIQIEEKSLENEKLRNELDSTKENDTTSGSELQTKIDKQLTDLKMLQGENDKYKLQCDKIEEVTVERDTLAQTVEKIKEELRTVESTLKIAKSENQDLLAEMKEINQILMERGGIISKQQSKISELEDKLGESNDALGRLKVEVNEKDRTITEMNTSSDRMNISVDNLSTSTISRADEIHRMRDIEDSYEEKYNKLRALAVKLKKKVSEQTIQITKLEGEKVPEDSGRLSLEVESLKQKLEDRENTLREATEKEKSTLVELEKMRVTAKKSNVLSLEMDAYEKSLNEVTLKLDRKKIEVQELESVVNALTGTNNSLKEQLRLVDESLESEKAHSKELKSQIDMFQTKLKETEHKKSELALKNEQLGHEVESFKLQLDEAKLKQSHDLANNEKLINTLTADKEKLLRQIYKTDEDVENLKQYLKSKEEELEALQTEFTAYKIRAQSILRQNQSRDSSREKELEEELTTVQQSNESLRDALSKSQQEYETQRRTVESIRLEKDSAQKRCKELTTLLEELRIQNETALEDVRLQNIEHQEIMKTQRIKIDALNACYKNQINEVEAKYQQEVHDLKDRISSSQIAAIRNDESPSVRTIAADDQQKIHMLLFEREEGEGSESVQPSQTSTTHQSHRKISGTRRGHDIIPLEDLLNNPFQEHVIEDRSASPTAELRQTKEKLIVHESRVRHLTTLLAEAEQDLARLNQLNDVLKEEVRRQQRSLDREQHIHNSEYIKNVIFKFLTLNSGDEKSHLVPVLNTLLKLSPDETHKLEAVAKGSGWLGKLPIWSNNN